MESALFLGVALLMGHTVKGITGFGSRLVAIPLLSFLWSPVEAIALCTVSDGMPSFPFALISGSCEV